ncbi:MAG: YbaB/EbfC family nucleoid-associated protein [Sphingobium sp.]|nr:YbaB/EbfC family nucleoid-associated protein [Sphingobium sp.]
MKDLNDLLGGDIMGMVGKLQEDMQRAQAELDSVEVEGVSGGGLVKIRASAKGRILGLAIDDSLIVPADKTLLEDLIVAAFNDAKAKADEAAGNHMGKVTAGLPLPPGFKMPF